jgi:hypothetical protein
LRDDGAVPTEWRDFGQRVTVLTLDLQYGFQHDSARSNQLGSLIRVGDLHEVRADIDALAVLLPADQTFAINVKWYEECEM